MTNLLTNLPPDANIISTFSGLILTNTTSRIVDVTLLQPEQLIQQ